MKIFAGTILTILIFAGASCQNSINVEQEKEAILALLQEEGEATVAMDEDRLFALHVQDESETRLELGEYGFNTYKGWDEVSALLGDFIDRDGELAAENLVNTRENMIIKVTGSTAWLTCDNTWEWTVNGENERISNIQIMFLEKIKGKWLISFSAYYNKTLSQ